MAEDNNITELIVKCLSGKATENEKSVVEEWKTANPANKSVFNDYQSIWENSEQLPANFLPDDDKAFHQVWDKIETRRPASPKVLPLLFKIAAGFILLIITVYLLTLPSPPIENLVYETTTQKKELVLPDGTKVILNRNCKIQYPEKFGQIREVYFEGEAYFDVIKNPERPFVINTQLSQIEVLGTAFNLRSRNEDEKEEVTVTEGKVAFSTKSNIKHNKTYLLKGEKGVHYKKDKILIKTMVTDENDLSWKTGKFIYRNELLRIVTEDLGSYYHKEIIVSSDELASMELTFSIDNRPLEEVLKVIELSLDVKIETEGDTIIISENQLEF